MALTRGEDGFAVAGGAGEIAFGLSRRRGAADMRCEIGIWKGTRPTASDDGTMHSRGLVPHWR